jgi:hypothetical protein
MIFQWGPHADPSSQVITQPLVGVSLSFLEPFIFYSSGFQTNVCQNHLESSLKYRLWVTKVSNPIKLRQGLRKTLNFFLVPGDAYSSQRDHILRTTVLEVPVTLFDVGPFFSISVVLFMFWLATLTCYICSYFLMFAFLAACGPWLSSLIPILY